MASAGADSTKPTVAGFLPRRIMDPESWPVFRLFDIASTSGEIVVPIDAKLGVLEPQAFAITLEQPGGVVVSDGPLLVVAAVGA